MRLVSAVLVVFAIGAAGCKKDSASSSSSGSAGSAVSAAAASGSCNDAINHSVDTMIARKKQESEAGGSGMGSDRMARLEKLRAALGERCTADKWSPAMIACVSAVTKQPELMQCMQANLDKDQTSHAMGAIATAMMGGRPGMGMGMSPGMNPGMDLDSAYQKRINAVAERLTAATAALASATAADKAVAQAKVDNLTREKEALEKSYAQMKAMHPGPLQGNAGTGSAPAPGSGSSTK